MNLCLLYFGKKYLSASETSGKRGAFGNVQNEQFPQKVLEHAFGEFVHLHMQYYSFANSILKHPAFQFFTSARKPTVNLYNTVYPLRSIQAFTSIISSEWNTMIGMPVSRLKER